MSDRMERSAHWEKVYTTKAEHEVSWFQERPSMSLDLIHASRMALNASIVDVGGGASRLVDFLLDEGYRSVSVLDVSHNALAAAKERLGSRSAQVKWIVDDVTTWEPNAGGYDLWHDRAAFHFMTGAHARDAYIQRLLKALRPMGHAIIGTFSLDGPEQCSGLPVVRYDPASLGEVLGSAFELVEARRDEHHTPMDRVQPFQFSWFRRL